MRRLLVRIAGLALCAGALAACSAGADHITLPSETSGDNAPMGSDLTAAIRQAQLLRLKGDLDGTTRILSQLMLAAPDDPRVVGEYGKLLVQQGRTADAVQFLQRAIELQPEEWTFYSALGVAYDQNNDRDRAKLAYEHALSLKPSEAVVLNNYAMSRMLAGDTPAARSLLMQAQATGSTDPKIAQNLALLNAMSPTPMAALPAPAPAMAAAPRTPVASNAVAPLASAHGVPQPITQSGTHGNTQVVMQAVPVDPLAGPVGRHRAAPGAKPARHVPARGVAANTPPKPAKPTKPTKTAKAHDAIPALRMTADASKP